MAAGLSSQHVQWIHLKEEVDENFLDVDSVVFDPHHEARLEPYTAYARPQLRSNDLAAMADSTFSRMSHVEAWINRELFSDVVEGEMCQDEGEMYITTLRKDVDEYIEMFDFVHHHGAVVPAIGEEQNYHMQPDDLFLSPVDSEYRGMYYDEPQLWCFS